MKYERIREARDLVSEMRLKGDNTYFSDCNEAGSRLRAVLQTLKMDLPATAKLAATEWNLDKYLSEGFQQQVADSRAELERAVLTLDDNRKRFRK